MLKQYLIFLLAINIPSLSLLGAQSKNSKPTNHLAMLEEDDIQQSLSMLEAETSSKKKRKSKYESLSVHAVDEFIVGKLSERFYKIVVDFESKSNSVFQTALSQVRKKAELLFLKKLESCGQASRSDEQNKKHFSNIWIEAINSIYEVEIDANRTEVSEEVVSFSEEEELEVASSSQEYGEKIVIKTTLLNILLRKVDAKEVVEKVQTIIENGADKNLHREFHSSPKMENQKEYPLHIILNEVGDSETRKKLLAVMLNDDVSYSYKSDADEEETRLDPISVSLKPNKDYVLGSLLKSEDFTTFNLVLNYLERCVDFIIESYTDQSSQIDDQIYCPILEKVLKKMMLIRRQAVSSDEKGNSIDNISEFFDSKILSKQIKYNPDIRFSMNFQNRLDKDFESLFRKISIKIDRTRTESELMGEELKKYVIEWTKWCNFRNRISKHLNKYALSASNEGKKSNVIKLIRYANIYDKRNIQSEEDEMFMELHVLGGADIIFVTRNKLKWTPLMYAMFQKQSEGIQLYLRQAPHEITTTDGVDNNILHLAFPLPVKYFKEEAKGEAYNVLDLVGANVGAEGAQEKTFEAIRAVITERSITIEDKITALTQLSASNFTPVSLAAATGYDDIYEFLVRFLKANDAWNEDDHAHLGIHVKELLVSGLKKYKASRVQHENLSSYEGTQLDSKIDEQEKNLESDYKNCIKEIYHSESYTATSLLNALRKPAKEILDAFYTEKGTKRMVAPYAAALKASIDEMINPTPTVEYTEIIPSDQTSEPLVEKKEKAYKRVLRAMHLMKKSKAEKKEPVAAEPIRIKQEKPSILDGMRNSTSTVKASYLGQIVREVTEFYLRDHVSPTHMSFDAVYKGLTNCGMKDFFQRTLNLSIEKKMQAIIVSVMSKSGRLRQELQDDFISNNRFDNLDHLSEHSSPLMTEESASSTRSEEDSEDEFGL